MSETITPAPLALTLSSSPAAELIGFAGNEGHPDFPCLTRTHNPASCVPCVDFSPWLRQRVRTGDVEGVAEYFWQIRKANPGAGESEEYFRARYRELASSLLAAPLDRHLAGGDEDAYLDLRVALILLAVHEGFSGFIMTGEAADFVASVMLPHRLTLVGSAELVERRNEFVRTMASEMSYWSGWVAIEAADLPSPTPPDLPELQRILQQLQGFSLGVRAHAVDALRNLSADARAPRTLPSLSRYETRKRGLDVNESTRQILATGLVMPATDLDAWLTGWTRRDLLAFLVNCGVRPRNSWSKERLAAMATAECADLLLTRMAESGAVELSSDHVEGARLLREYSDRVRETWRVWLGFGTGVELRGTSGEC
jgi:hypothetical protein